MDSVRLDRWLCAARVFRSRTQAAQACDAGHVRVNDVRVKASAGVKLGDEVRVQKPRRIFVLEIVALAEKRLSPAQARELYLDRSPAPPPRESAAAAVLARERGAGRPTKRDRRQLQRLRGRDWSESE